jgi:hypothetical protein
MQNADAMLQLLQSRFHMHFRDAMLIQQPLGMARERPSCNCISHKHIIHEMQEPGAVTFQHLLKA